MPVNGYQPEWLEGNSKIAYPFRQEVSIDLALTGSTDALILDAYISYQYEGNTADLELKRLSINSIGDAESGGGVLGGDLQPLSSSPFFESFWVQDSGMIGVETSTAPSIGCIIKYTDGSVFIDNDNITSASFKQLGQYLICNWKNATKNVTLILNYSKFIDYVTMDINFTNAVFCDRCLDINTDNVISISPQVSSAVFNSLVADIRVTAGYNIELKETVDAGSGFNIGNTNTTVSKVLLLSAIPGAGQGKYDTCQNGNPYIATINGVNPDGAGRFILDSSLCYFAARPATVVEGDDINMATVSDNTLVLHNSCSSCCTCEQYKNIYEAIRVILNKFKTIGLSVEDIRTRYNDAVDLVNTQRECREIGPTLKFDGVSRANFILSLNVLIVNNSSCEANIGIGSVNITCSHALQIVPNSLRLYSNNQGEGHSTAATAIINTGNTSFNIRANERKILKAADWIKYTIDIFITDPAKYSATEFTLTASSNLNTPSTQTKELTLTKVNAISVEP